MPFKAFSILGEIGVRGHKEARSDLTRTARTATSTGRTVGAASGKIGRASTDAARRLQGLGRAGTDASRGVKKVGQAAQESGGKLKGLISELGGARLGYAALAAGAGAALVSLGKSSSEFQERMRELAAVTGASSDQLDRMRTAALETGRATNVGATEASSALQALARAGLSAEEAVDALHSTISIARISQIDLGTAADVTVGVLRAFDLKASQSARVTDVLSHVANNTRVQFQQLAQSLAITGSTANSMGVSLEKTAALVGLLSDAGINGESAGELVRTMFRKIEAASPPAIKRFNELGIALKDTEGNARALFDVLKDMEEANVGLADSSLLFEAEYGAAVKSLLDKGIPAVEALAASAEEATGATQEMFDTIEDGVAGSLREFKAAVEDLKLALADEGGLNDAMEWTLDLASKLARTMADSTRSMSNFNESLDEGRTIIDLGGTAQLTDKAFKQAIDRINEASFAMHKKLPSAMRAVAESSGEAKEAIAAVAVEIERLDANKLFAEIARAERAAEAELRRVASQRESLGVSGPLDTEGAPTITGQADARVELPGAVPEIPDDLGRTQREREAYSRVGVLTRTELEAAVERAKRDVELIAHSSGATQEAVNEAVERYEEAQKELEEAITGRRRTDWGAVLRGATQRLGESMTEILFEQGGSFGSTWGERLTSLGKAFKRLFVREVAQGALALGKALLGISGGRGRRGAFDWLTSSTKTATKATDALFGSIETGAAGSTSGVNKLARALSGLSAGPIGVATGIAGKILDGINEAYKAVLKAIKKAGVEIWGFIKAAALAIWGPIKAAGLALWEPIKAASLAIWGAIKAAGLALWEPIKAAGLALWSPIKALGLALWEPIKTAGLALWEPIKATGLALWSSIKAAGLALWDPIKALGLAIWEPIKAVALALWEPIKTAGLALWEPIKAAGLALWEPLKTAGLALWEAIKSTGLALWKPIKVAGLAVWDAVKAVALGLWDPIKAAGLALWDPIKAAALAIWAPIKAAALAVWPLIANAGKGIWAGIKAAGIKLWDGIGLLAKPIWAAIRTAGLAVWDLVKAAGLGIWAGIKAAGVAVWDGVGALAGPVWDAIKLAGVSIWDAIRTVATSIWDVIKEAGEDFWRVLKRLASPIWDAIKAIASSVFDLLRPGANKLNDYLTSLSEAPRGGGGIPGVPTTRRPTEGSGGVGGGSGGGIPGVAGAVLGPIGAAVDLVTGVWSRFEANSDRNQANTYLKGIAQNQVTLGEHLEAIGKRVEFVELAIRGTDGLQSALVNRFTTQWSGRMLEYADDTLARLRLFHEFVKSVMWARLGPALSGVSVIQTTLDGMKGFVEGTMWPGMQPAIGSLEAANQTMRAVKADTTNLTSIATGIQQVRAAVDGVRGAVLSLELDPVINVNAGGSQTSPVQQRDALDALDRALASPSTAFRSGTYAGSSRTYSRSGATSTSRSTTSSRTSSSRSSTARRR